ncbi:MAG: hypothetical protein RIS90_478 [Pseudomonadota bacterium]|jgi:uncharacterized protein (DUF4415 family)
MSVSKRVTPITWADPDDAPELTNEFFERADLYRDDKLVRRGRPKATQHKEPVTLRVDPEVLAAWRASGKGWQTRAAAALAAQAPKSQASA